MNYFGHVAVASWRSTAPGVFLGAMLPDFSTMSGARVASTSDADVQAGIDLHHTTDAAFHVLPAVTGLMRELDDALASRGCARGPRRAVAHIGVELLLDGVLVDEPAYRDAYLAGIAHDTGEGPGSAEARSDTQRRGGRIEWREPGDDRRMATLLERLRGYGVPEDLRKPESIVFRLSRMLAHRPLLAPSQSDLSAIGAAIAELQPRVSVATDTVLRGMRAALSEP